jgi:hypothetical protein
LIKNTRNAIEIICSKSIEAQQFEEGKMKEESNVTKEKVKMKTTNKTCEWRKKTT